MPNKTVVISDVHLSNGPTPYSWFKDDSKLKGFLNETAKRADVKELVLLGDIFDLWLYPIDEMPWTAEQIIQHWNGADSVVGALKKCADKLPNVFYINGNHDMRVTAADLALISPKIKFTTANEYNVGHANKLHFEHGHLVDMFNAPPDILDEPIKGLPFGYFITRMVATVENHDALWDYLAAQIKSHLEGLFFFPGLMQHKMSQEIMPASVDSKHSILEKLIEKLVDKAGKELVELIIKVLLEAVQVYYPDVSESSTILLPDGSTVTIGEVKQHYHPLLLNWYRKLGSLPDLYRSALASTDLAWYADKLLRKGPANLVIMGHTHESTSMSQSKGLYANSGCWITGKEFTYVEVDLSASPQAVVKAYHPGTTPLTPAMFLVRRSPVMTSSGLPMTDEAAWDEEPLPQFWQQRSEPTE